MLTDYILIQLNGQPFNCAPLLSLKDLIIYLGFDLSSVVLEYNGEIIRGVKLETLMIVSGDKIEVVSIVGGG